MGRHREEEEESEDYSEQEEGGKVEVRRPKIERIDKFKNLKRIVMNISMTQYPVVAEVAEELNWRVQTSNEAGDWDVYWTDFAIDPDILIKMHLFQKINHYPGIHVIARKNLLGLNLMQLRNKFPDHYNFFPLTWMLPLQYAEFRAYYETKPKGKARTYIAKPQADCQGRGIFLTRKIQDFENGKHYVIQRYLAKPYLLQGLKFDLRIYVLLCGTNPLRLYMYNQGLARLATEPYVEPNTSNLQKQYVHLTNYAINKNNPKFVFNNSSNNMGVGHKRSLTCVFKQLAAKGLNVQQLKQKINDVAIKTIICGLPLMSHQYKCSQPQDYAGNMCFHILGLDIMLNSKGEPVLLEVNHTPSFTTDTPLDHKIKFNLIKDTLVLMNVNSKSKQELFAKAKELNKDRLLTGKRQIFEGKDREAAVEEAQRLRDQFEDKHLGGFTRIFPLKDEEKMKDYNTIIDAANRSYAEDNGSIRLKMMEKQAKQAKKIIRRKEQAVRESSLIGSTTAASEGQSCHIKPITRNINSEHCLAPADINIKKELSFQQREEESIEQPEECLTRSEQPIQNRSEMFVQKLSESANKQSDSCIKIRKYESQQPSREQSKNSRISEAKGHPSRKRFPIRQAAPSAPHQPVHSQQTIHRDRIRSNTMAKAASRRQPTRNPPLQEFPNIIDMLAYSEGSPVFRKDEKLLVGCRNPKEVRSNKIYDHISRDIRDMIDRKGGNNGGYVMPKLINISLDPANERRTTDSGHGPYRKGNIYSNVNNE